MFTRTTRAAAVTAVGSALIVVGLTTAPAARAVPSKLSMSGVGSATVPVEGTATFAGHLSGTPLSGEYLGLLEPADGSLPGLGTCEPASARMSVQDERGRVVELWAEAGSVCSVLLPLGTMQAFDGRFRVASTSERRLRRVEGAVQVRLLGELSDVYAVGG